jgi:hypothetical protein
MSLLEDQLLGQGNDYRLERIRSADVEEGNSAASSDLDSLLHNNTSSFENKWSRLLERLHVVMGVVGLDIIYLGIFLLMFAATAAENEEGMPTGAAYVSGAITILLFGVLITALLPAKPLLFGQYVFIGALYLIYFKNSGHVSWVVRDIYKVFPFLIMTSILLYFMGPCVTLLDRHYTSLLKSFNSLSLSPSSRFQPMTIVFLRNLLSYFLPFFCGLHWGYAPKLFHVEVNLDPNSMAHWGLAQFIAVPVGLLLATVVLVFHVRLMISAYKRYKGLAVQPNDFSIEQAGPIQGYVGGDDPSDPVVDWGPTVQKVYLGGYLSVFSVLIVVSLLAKAVGDEFHLHHYFLMMMLLPFTRFRHPFSAMCQGFFLGVHMDGMLRWGMDPLWVTPLKYIEDQGSIT